MHHMARLRLLRLNQMHDGYDDDACCVGVIAELIIALVVMAVLFSFAVWC